MMRTFVLLTALLFIPISDAEAQIPQIERNALMALYNSTDGANWLNYTNNWLGPIGTECTWRGISCANGHVSEIDLDFHNLNGNLPHEIGNLPGLQKLNMQAGRLSGSIPPELGNLSSLQSLNLIANQLSGSLPPELGNLLNLQILDLELNKLSGTIPPELGNLSNLHHLSIYHNQLSGCIPPELGNLSNLQGLYLGDNQLSGSIPPELGNLSNLQRLYLGDNQLSGSIPPDLGNLSNLQQLSLGYNELSGSIPPELGYLPNVETLSMAGNNLTGNIPPELGNLSSMNGSLSLHHNQLSGSIPPELGNLTNLRGLYLSHNRLTGNIPPELGNLLILRTLALSHNQLTGNIPTELVNISNLAFLFLNSNQLGGSIPQELENLTHLHVNHGLGHTSPSDIAYNAFWAGGASLHTFLDIRVPHWDETQTVAPTGLTVVSSADRTVWLEWTPIMYSADRGRHEIESTPMICSGSSWRPYENFCVTSALRPAGFTSSKSQTMFPVTGLQPGRAYSFTVTTMTFPHSQNQNVVISEPSHSAGATTSNIGCATPVITVSGQTAPYTLTVTSLHDSYEWMTGETTASITVSPQTATWYWVKATGPGFCKEAASVQLEPELNDD